MNSHLLLLFISLGEVDKISGKFILRDHVRNSHDHSVLQSINILLGASLIYSWYEMYCFFVAVVVVSLPPFTVDSDVK